MKTLSAILLLCATVSYAADTRLAGIVRDTTGQRLAGLTIHFFHRHASGFDHLTVTTGTNGAWSIELPAGEWRAAAQSDDILKRGYFCFPGFVWCGAEGGTCDGEAWPPLWGGGFIDWNPVINPGQINLTVVPTRPDLRVEKPRTAAAGVTVSFETTVEPMATIRQWRIEKSTDLQSWTMMQTVALSGTSPVIVPDPDSTRAPVCYYRAVQVEDIVPLPPAAP